MKDGLLASTQSQGINVATSGEKNISGRKWYVFEGTMERSGVTLTVNVGFTEFKGGVAFYTGIGLTIQDLTRKVRVRINLEHAFHGSLCREQVPGPTEVVQINYPQGALTPGHPHHQAHRLLTRRAS